MSIVVVGGGAIGLLVAGQLACSGQHVALLARPATVAVLRSDALYLLRRGGMQAANLASVATTPDELAEDYRQPDLAILCVKGYDTTSALETVHALQPWQMLTLQNGLGHEERLAQEFGAERVLSGAITSSVVVEAPGRVLVTRAGGIGLAGVSRPPRLRVWGAVLGKAGFHVREYRNYRALKWSKVLLNMLANATPAILDMPIKQVYADPRLIELERRAFLEALAVMQQQGIHPVDLPSYPVVALARAMRLLPDSLLYPLLRRAVAGGRGGKLPSLHADLQQQRPVTEGEYIYGAVAQAAHDAGLDAPVNTLLWQTLRAIASGDIAWDTLRQQPECLLAMMK